MVQINERGGFQGFRDPDMSRIEAIPASMSRVSPTTACRCGPRPARRQPLERVDASGAAMVMDTYAMENFTGWTPELAPPPDLPLFRWRVLAGVFRFDVAS